jgi:hypothetical protein
MHPTRTGLVLTVILFLTADGRGQEEPKPIKDGEALPGTQKLTMQGDIAAHLVAGVDKFLLAWFAWTLKRAVSRRLPSVK